MTGNRRIVVFYKPLVEDHAKMLAGEAEKLGYQARLVKDPGRDTPISVVTPYGVYRDPWQALAILKHAARRRGS